MPSVTVYHGTTEKEAERGLKNPDNLNTNWAQGLLPPNSHHLTTDLNLAKGYASSGVPRKYFKESEKRMNDAIDDVQRTARDYEKKLGLDPDSKMWSVWKEQSPHTFKKKYPNVFKLGEVEYEKRVKQLMKFSKSLYIAFDDKVEQKKLEDVRGQGGYVLSFTLTPKKVLAFSKPFDSLDKYELFSALQRMKGKFQCIYFPSSYLRPENMKGGRVKRSDYYIVVGTKLLSNQKRIDL
jgi:hypothetical protein